MKIKQNRDMRFQGFKTIGQENWSLVGNARQLVEVDVYVLKQGSSERNLWWFHRIHASSVSNLNLYILRSILLVSFPCFTSTYITVFWDVIPYNLVQYYWRFGRPCCLHLQVISTWRWRQNVPSLLWSWRQQDHRNRWQLFTRLRGVTF
jgi:hypothetical protein